MLLVLAALDWHFVQAAYQATLTQGASVQLVFGFEYAILLTMVAMVIVKYGLHTYDIQRENPWEDKAVFLLYAELVIGNSNQWNIQVDELKYSYLVYLWNRIC